MASPLICLLGPTGAGKSSAALALAEELHGAIVNFDSRQVYAGLPIVTDQPGAADLARAPHYLYGFLNPSEAISAGAYADMAERTLAQVREKGLVPILTGGTGLYLEALLRGLDEIPEVDPEVRKAVQAAWDSLGGEMLHGWLERIDPDSAARIHVNDRQRVTRALEVFEATGTPLSDWRNRERGPARHSHIKIGLRLPIDELAPGLAARIDEMAAGGAVEEVRSAYAAHPDRNAPGFTGIGCAEIIAHLEGELTLDQAKALWFKRTRAYAKRQLTWFGKDPDVAWFAPGAGAAILERARSGPAVAAG